jgi:hypothetical protein
MERQAKTNIQRTFNPENVAVPGPERLSAAQNNLPSANFDGGDLTFLMFLVIKLVFQKC